MVSGRLNSKPGKSYTIQFFECVLGGGNISFLFLGSTDEENPIQTDIQGNSEIGQVFFDLPISNGDFIAATATDPKGNTSEFSVPCIEVGEE